MFRSVRNSYGAKYVPLIPIITDNSMFTQKATNAGKR